MSLLRRRHRAGHTCPWWFAYTFDNALRGLVHRPSEILGGLVRRGDTVVDVGSGLGFFTLAMADIVGPEGKVISVDVQEQMLKRSRRRAERRGLVDRIEFHQASHKGMGLSAPVDFVLAFWMVHEVRDRVGFLAEVRSILRPTGHLLIAEPKGHVSPALFARITDRARDAGFLVKESRDIRFSRSILCVPKSEPAQLEAGRLTVAVELTRPQNVGGWMDGDLDALSREQLIVEVKRLRAGIRAHRDTSEHELCWHHPALWNLLPDNQDPLPTVPDWPQFMRGCIRYRQSLDDQLPNAPRTRRESSRTE